MTDLLPTATITAALGASTVGGVFFAFSTFVVPALRRLSAQDSVRSMQAINRAAVTAPFMLALFGTGLLCLALAVVALRHLDVASGRLLLAGAATYVITGVIVTVAANVPRNDRLAAVDADTGATAGWDAFAGSWTAWNHVRTIGCLLACLLFVLAARATSTASDSRAAASVSRSTEWAA